MARTASWADIRRGVQRGKDRPALLDVEIHERREQAAAARAAVMMEGNPLAVAIGKFGVALINRGRPVLIANRLIALPGERTAHHLDTAMRQKVTV